MDSLVSLVGEIVVTMIVPIVAGAGLGLLVGYMQQRRRRAREAEDTRLVMEAFLRHAIHQQTFKPPIFEHMLGNRTIREELEALERDIGGYRDALAGFPSERDIHDNYREAVIKEQAQ